MEVRIDTQKKRQTFVDFFSFFADVIMNLIENLPQKRSKLNNVRNWRNWLAPEGANFSKKATYVCRLFLP